MNKIGTLSIIAAISMLSGCAVQNSIPVEYHNQAIEGVTVSNFDPVGVTQWNDQRSIASIKDDYSEKAVMRTGPATIGITHNGSEFVRVADFVRDNFIKELQSLGVNVKPIDIIPSSNSTSLLKGLAQNNEVNVIISGDLINFDFNCHGAMTLDCSRKVSISMSMVDQLGNELITRELFDSTMANNEGMGVLHKTVLDQMTNQVMREALKKAVIKTVQELNKKS